MGHFDDSSFCCLFVHKQYNIHKLIEFELGIMVMRIYALYERKAWVAVLYLVVCLSVIGLAVVCLLSQRPKTRQLISRKWALTLGKPRDNVVIPKNYGCGIGMDKHQSVESILG